MTLVFKVTLGTVLSGRLCDRLVPLRGILLLPSCATERGGTIVCTVGAAEQGTG